MDSTISNDEVRRELRAVNADHAASLAPTAELIDRLYQEGASEETKLDVLVGGAHRLPYLKIGGVAVLTGAFLAACGSSDKTTADTTLAPTTTVATDPGDVKALQFAASLEQLAVAAYKAGAPLVTTPVYATLAKTFLEHHTDHAALFNAAIKSYGGTAVDKPNDAYLTQFKPALDALKTESDVLKFALTLETAAASTYFAQQGNLKNPKLGATLVSIGGTEYRHAALLSHALKMPIASTAKGFLTDKEALAPKGV